MADHRSLQRGIFSPFTTILLVLLMALALPVSAADAEKGGKLFSVNCASCHAVHKKVIGPALLGVGEKYEKEWLYKWVKNSQAMVASGDEQAVAIFEEYDKSIMTAFPALSNSDIDDILAYIPTVKPPTDDVVVTPGAGDTSQAGWSWTPANIFLVLITLLLLGIILIMSRIVGNLGNLIREREGLPAKAPMTLGTLWSSKLVKVGACLLVFLLLGYTAIDSSQSLGRQQGYQPEQPINFSHKLHAGTHNIDCQYCHSGARIGKSAVIPSANICMNCHKQVAAGPTGDTEEIAKIYSAIGWDPEKKEYIEDYVQKPIEWVRIHNLPDHVYFNHAQHVVAGKQECQTCHGPVEEMDVVEQHSTLGMGWCIDCHRTTNVDFSGNEYYDIYHKYKDAGKNQVTVEDIGGTECQKCHY